MTSSGLPFANFLPRHRRALTPATLALCALCLGSPFSAAQSGPNIANREIARRADMATQAQALITRGDEAYRKGDYAEATSAYRQALDATPAAPATADFRRGIIQRVCIASCVQAQVLANSGDYAQARTLVEKTLLIDPNYSRAKTLLAQLDDPVRFNPAKSPQYVANVQQVNAQLRQAFGFIELGEFDKAQAAFENVLRIDPYNTAARRGLERLANLKMEYYSAANDQTRAKMLMEVAKLWETDVAPARDAIIPGSAPGDTAAANSSQKLQLLASEIRIPKVSLENTTLPEVVDFLRAAVRRDPNASSINFILGNSPELKAKTITLQLENIPLNQLLDYIARQAECRVNYTPFAISLTSTSEDPGMLITRSFPLTPDFFSQQAPAAASDAADDPFTSSASNKSPVKVSRRDPASILASMGVSFNKGAFARYNPSNSTLTVCNTPGNIDLVEQIVEGHMQKSLDQVLISCTVIEANEKTLSELGFDWALGITPQGGMGGFISGGGVNPSTIFPNNLVPNGSYQASMMSGGLRSGNQALPKDSLDDRITAAFSGDPFSTSGNNPAPGIIAVRGVINHVQFMAMMRGLEQKKGIDKLERPTVIAKSGQKSILENIREFSYPEAYDPPEIPSSFGVNNDVNDNNNNNNNNNNGPAGISPVTPSHPNSFVKRDLGTILEVEPMISEDKQTVEVNITPKFSEFEGFVNYGSPINYPLVSGGEIYNFPITPNLILQPVFSTKRLSASVTVHDGCTIVLGGLLKSRIREYEDKIPVMGDIPLVGRLFRSTGKEVEKKAIIILCNVKIIDPTGRGTGNSTPAPAEPAPAEPAPLP